MSTPISSPLVGTIERQLASSRPIDDTEQQLSSFGLVTDAEKPQPSPPSGAKLIEERGPLSGEKEAERSASSAPEETYEHFPERLLGVGGRVWKEEQEPGDAVTVGVGFIQICDTVFGNRAKADRDVSEAKTAREKAETALEEKEAILKKKDALIAKQDTLIHEKDDTIAKPNALLEKKDGKPRVEGAPQPPHLIKLRLDSESETSIPPCTPPHDSLEPQPRQRYPVTRPRNLPRRRKEKSSRTKKRPQNSGKSKDPQSRHLRSMAGI